MDGVSYGVGGGGGGGGGGEEREGVKQLVSTIICVVVD